MTSADSPRFYCSSGLALPIHTYLASYSRLLMRPLYLRPLCLAVALGLQACSSGFDKANEEVHRTSNERSQQAQVLARQVRPITPLVTDERVRGI